MKTSDRRGASGHVKRHLLEDAAGRGFAAAIVATGTLTPGLLDLGAPVLADPPHTAQEGAVVSETVCRPNLQETLVYQAPESKEYAHRRAAVPATVDVSVNASARAHESTTDQEPGAGVLRRCALANTLHPQGNLVTVIDFSGAEGYYFEYDPGPQMVGLRVSRYGFREAAAEAVVTSANSELTNHGAVNREVHEACGNELLENLREVAPEGCKTGSCVVTEAFGDLKKEGTQFVIHVVGPVVAPDESGRAVPTKEQEKQLYKCYQNCLAAASARNVRSVSIPAISTGRNRFPLEQAAKVCTKAVVDYFQKHGRGSIETVSFACPNFSNRDAMIDALLEVTHASNPDP